MKTCRPWCVDHLHDDDMCVAPNVTLDFGDRGEGLLLTSEAVVDLTEAPDSTCVMIHLNGIPAAELDPDQAAAIGWALLSQAAQTRRESITARRYRDFALHHADQAARAAS